MPILRCITTGSRVESICASVCITPVAWATRFSEGRRASYVRRSMNTKTVAHVMQGSSCLRYLALQIQCECDISDDT